MLVGFPLTNKADGYKRLVKYGNNRTICDLRLDYRNPDRI
jgi:hypothetical protein